MQENDKKSHEPYEVIFL